MKWKLTSILLVCIFLVSGSYAQGKKKSKKIKLNGIVLDAKNNPVQNAIVFVDEKNTNVKSNKEGKFRIKIKPSVKAIMVFTIFNGADEVEYKGQEEIIFTLKGAGGATMQDPLNVPIEEDKEMINVGYGTTDKRKLTTSVGVVNDERIKSARNYTNIFDMIRGEVPGVVVSGNSITIRGMSSLTLSNEPLFIVNGSPSFGISNISPNDVKSISVLKGSSAAIYGSRGANGVILIVLKSASDL